MPLPVVTVNGEVRGGAVSIVTCRGNLPLFLTLKLLFFVLSTFTLPNFNWLVETLKVPTGVGVAVGVSVAVADVVAVAVAVLVAVADEVEVGVVDAVAE